MWTGELFLWYGWPTEGVALFTAGTIVEILTVANLRHATSRIWTCAEPEFRLYEWSCAVVITTTLRKIQWGISWNVLLREGQPFDFDPHNSPNWCLVSSLCAYGSWILPYLWRNRWKDVHSHSGSGFMGV